MDIGDGAAVLWRRHLFVIYDKESEAIINESHQFEQNMNTAISPSDIVKFWPFCALVRESVKSLA
jgi:hypothetical protein